MTRNETAVWNRFSGIYDVIIKKDMPAYGAIIERVKALLKPESRVFEIATGTGCIALGIAESAQNVEAADISPDMIERAKKKAQRMGISNVRFSVQDVCALPYHANSFDTVIIANTLHIMPQPEKALAEIRRVLTPDGCLVAPTFVYVGKKAAVLSRLMSLTGFRVYHKWSEKSYLQFLVDNGFSMTEGVLLKSSFPIAYVEARKTGGPSV